MILKTFFFLSFLDLSFFVKPNSDGVFSGSPNDQLLLEVISLLWTVLFLILHFFMASDTLNLLPVDLAEVQCNDTFKDFWKVKLIDQRSDRRAIYDDGSG